MHFFFQIQASTSSSCRAGPWLKPRRAPSRDRARSRISTRGSKLSTPKFCPEPSSSSRSRRAPRSRSGRSSSSESSGPCSSLRPSTSRSSTPCLRTWCQSYKKLALFVTDDGAKKLEQGLLKGEVSLYSWPPVWLVWISPFCKWNQYFRLSYNWFQTSQTGGQRYSDTSPISFPCTLVSFVNPAVTKKKVFITLTLGHGRAGKDAGGESD